MFVVYIFGGFWPTPVANVVQAARLRWTNSIKSACCNLPLAAQPFSQAKCHLDGWTSHPNCFQH